MVEFITKSATETKKLARSLSYSLKVKDVIGLIGDLGSGKTTFVKGLAKGLKIKEEEVISPSYVLMREYKGKVPLYHLDLYRLNYLEEVELLGYQDYFYGDGITCIEWADKIMPLLPKNYLKIVFKALNPDKRKITFYSTDNRFKKIIEKIS